MTRMNHLIPRSGIAGLLAAGMLMVGSGMGAAVMLSTPAASAATSHSSLPPVNVNVTNTPSVNVANFPEKSYNGTSRLLTQPGRGRAQFSQTWGQWVNGQGVWAVNLSGSGVFKGLILSAYQDGNGACIGANVIIDGQTMLGDNIWGAAQFGTNLTGVEGGQMRRNGAYADVMYFTPPGGLAFHSSLQVHISDYCNQANPVAWRVWWSQNN
ncbi:MAG: hypothetical protein M0008_06285 [Actinomycetota bacterium]|nr:hypothetical protein [Actinomycetota bacterium]